jgi:hypothetical protein
MVRELKAHGDYRKRLWRLERKLLVNVFDKDCRKSAPKFGTKALLKLL